MRLPDVLSSLTDQGVIDEVVRPLKSGKEAQVYLVGVAGEQRVAKVYKDASSRSFKQRAAYTEGRRVRSSRDQRAMAKRTRHGKAQEEAAWKSAEVDVIYRLHAAGVRVPMPYNFIDGVLLMELVRGDDGHPAPRLSELSLDPVTARAYFDQLLAEVVRMLCAGVVHGDLSDFNVLIDDAGPVIIDFPQAVDAASNRNAKKLLLRDVNNLSSFLQRCAPGTRRLPYGEELWSAYESNRLTPDYQLTGKHRRSKAPADVAAVLDQIDDADRDEARRRGDEPTDNRPRRREVVIRPAPSEGAAQKGAAKSRRRRRKGPVQEPRRAEAPKAGPDNEPRRREAPKADSADAPKRRRRRRRRKAPAEATGSSPAARESAQPAPTPASDGAAKPRRRRRRRKKRTPGSGGA